MADMPARIWAGANSPNPASRYWLDYKPRYEGATSYIRADLVEQMAAALRIIAGQQQCIDNLMSNADVARAALAAWETSNG